MKVPTISVNEDIMTMDRVYHLRIPYIWLVKDKWYKFRLTYWMIKMIWSKK